MLGMPAPTPYDLNFRLLGIPVRISPWFWVVSIVFGVSGTERGDILGLVIWVACVFASILIHEFGHGLTARRFGYRPEIALYGMGGLCASESERQSPGERLAVLFAGPGYQFALLGAVCVFGWLALKISWRGDLFLGQVLLTSVTGFNFSLGADRSGAGEIVVAMSKSPQFRIYANLFYINLVWPLLNLLPIYPLDGGQIAQVLMTKADWRNGARRSHIVSLVTAGIIAAYLLMRMLRSGDGQGGLFMVFFFASFAFLNYRLLQAYHHGYISPSQDDSDWWRR